MKNNLWTLFALFLVAGALAAIGDFSFSVQDKASEETIPAAGDGASGFPFVLDLTAGGVTPLLVDGTLVGNRSVRSISCRNNTATRCYWGSSAVDAGAAVGGTGSSHCSSGCDTTAPMGGDFREIYIDCAASTAIDCHIMTYQN